MLTTKKTKIIKKNSSFKVGKKVTSILTLSNLKNLHQPKKRKRVGRGTGSGIGKTATAGHKGQRSRSGHKIKASFEGGQMPFHRRIPKNRGFKSINPHIYQVVNLYKISKSKMILVNNETLLAANLITHLQKPVKILGEGQIDFSATFQIAAVSTSAQKKILLAGGKIILAKNA